jgi:hypothetical protein
VVLYDPTAQMPLRAVRPVVPQNEPAAHGVQLDWPALAANVPNGHATHAVASEVWASDAPNLPAAQLVGAIEFAVAPHQVPAGQLAQADIPVAG